MGYTTGRNLDKLLVRYVERLPQLSRKNTAERLMAAINHLYPDHQDKIKVMSRYLKQLRRAYNGNTKPPMIEEVVLQVAYILIKQKMPVTAIAVLLQFDCYLRPAEISSILTQHIAFPGGGMLGRKIDRVLLLLPKTKTGYLQSVDIRSKMLIKALKRYTVSCKKDQQLFPRYQVYAKRVLAAVKALSLEHIGYTLHSIRHGGATTDLINLGYPGLAQIMYRGRWESLAGRRYLQRGAASLLYAELPDQFIKEAAIIKGKLEDILQKCPLIVRH